MNIVIWSKDDCAYCEQAKSLLKAKDIEFEERNISQGTWTREQLFEAVPNARSVPQILIDDVLLGGLPELRKYLVK